jgi:hypothetical protein
MGQDIVVFAIVAVAAVYAAWKLLPAGALRPVLGLLLPLARSIGIGDERLARWSSKAPRKACGACDACNGCDPAATTSTIRIEKR